MAAAKTRRKKPAKSVKKPKPAKSKPKAKPAPARKKKAAPKKAKPAVRKPKPKPTKASRPTPARDARKALAQKQAIVGTLSGPTEGAEVVDAYLRDVDHPFKAEMQAVREIILGASDKLRERIKWNAPSFYYKQDLGAFNPRAAEFAHLILLFPGGLGMEGHGSLLEGKHQDRREVKFFSLDDVKAKRRALEKLVEQWVALRDQPRSKR
jgi:hypothetical protein